MAVAAPSPTPVEEDFKSAYADLQPPAEDFKSAYADLAAPPEEDFKAAYADLSPDAAVPETAKALGETANEWSKGAGLPALVNPDFAVMPEGAVPTTERDLLKPYVEIPSVPQQEGTLAQIGAGAVNVPVGFANFMLSPAGMMTAATGGAGLIPKAAQTLAGAGFTAQQIKDFFNAQTLQERITTGVGAALLGVATVFGAKTKTPTGEPNATTQGEIKPIAATPRTETQATPATEAASEVRIEPAQETRLPIGRKTKGETFLLKQGDETVGAIEAEYTSDGLQVFSASVKPELRGKGHAVSMYEALLNKVGTIVSDTSVSESAARVYDSLKRRGWNVEKNPNAVLEDGQLKTKDDSPVFKASKQPATESAGAGNVDWVRGESQQNASGDTFFSRSSDVAANYGDIRPMRSDEMPKNVLEVTDKPDLADKIGYKGDPLAEPLDTPADQKFDTLAKRYAQAKGHDGIEYSSGTFGEPELHVFKSAETAGAGDVVPFDNPWLRRKNKTQESSPAAAASATPLQDAWEKYDGTGEIQTVPDLVDHVENLIAEGKAPESLQGAVDAYREAAHEDFTEFAGRGNADAYERAFTDAVQGAEVFQPKPSQVEAFHGSPSGTITKFSKKHQAAEGGYFFATQPDIAQVYAGKDGGVTPVSLTVKNPLVMTADQWSSPEWTSPSEAKKLGYDSIKIVAHDPAFEGKPASDTWIVFDSKQIKPSPPAATGATAQNLFIKIGDKTYPVDSLKDASDKFSTARTKTFEQGVGSEALPLNPTIVDSKGNPVGRISQNGNIWDAKNPKELIHNATGLVKRADGTWGLPEKQAKPTPSAPNPTLPEKPVQSKPVDTADSVEKPVDAKAPAETGAKAEAAAPPEPPAAAEVPPEQPQKPSKIGQSIEAKAVEAKLTKGFAETAGYDPITIRDQAQRATDLIKSSLPDARNIIRGEAVLPDGLRGTSLITAMEEHLLQHPDAQMAYELANSPLTSATSAAAQEMRLMAERVPDGITAKFSEIREARKAGAKQRGETPQRVAKEVTKEIVKNSSKRPTWDAFVREITC